VRSIKSAPFIRSLNLIKVKNLLRPLIVVTILSSQLAFQGIADAATTSTLTTTELNSPSLDWRSIAISSDGTKIVAASTGAIYVSSDSGTTWTSKYSGPNFNSVALSGDGNKIMATNRGNQNSYIYTSTNFGTSWTTSRPSGYECWNSCKIEMSTDATRIYLTNYDNGIYVSSDSGVNWTRTSTSQKFNTFSASSDGQYAVAAQDGGYIYKSSDYGSTWNQITNAGNKSWVSITVSDDGQKIAASAWENYVYTSDNGGTTWTTRTEISGQKIYLSSSADGNTIVAGKYNGYLSISGDGGANWNTEPVNRGWNNSAVTSDGLTAFLTIGEATGNLRSISISPSSTTPSAPTSLSATAGDGQTTISFTAGSSGGSAITNYKYSLDGTNYTALSPTDSSSPITISGLTNGTSYTIYLKAVNSYGDSSASSSVSVTPATTPSEPTSLVASAGNGQASISFTAGSNGGSAITNYKYSLDGTNFTELSPADSSTPVIIPGLTNGTSYTIYLKAVNSVGESAASSPVSVTPDELSGISGINWLAESGTSVVFNQNYVGALDSAFNPVSSWPYYIYAYSNSSANQTYYAQSINCSNNWRWEQILCDPSSRTNDLHYLTKLSQHSGLTTSNSSGREIYVVVDLGTSRIFNSLRVFQMFSDGKVTQASLFVNSTTGSSRPSYNDSGWQLAGQSVVGQGINNISTVSCPTAISLGTQNSRYVKLVFKNTGEYGNSSYLEVGGVKLFYETGSEAGPSPSVSCPAAPTHSLSPVWAPAATTPSAPTSLAATAGDGQTSISFTAGSSGGSAITNYKYSLDGTNYTALSPTDSSSPVTISGLTNGTSYTIYLKAVNSYGDSSASSSVSVTPATTPSAPTSLTASAGNGSATISFTAGSNGGSAITNYKYSLDGTNYTALSPTDSSSPVTISGLTNGTSYTIYLKAVNARGDSSASSSVSVTPSTTPSAPTSLTATAGDGQATISFTAGSNGGSAITNYKYSLDGTNYTALSPTDSSSPVTISGLTNGTSYTIYLKAVNANGDSSASSSVSVTPVAPAVPTGDSSGPNNYFEPIRKVEVSNGIINWEPNRKVVISKFDPSSKKSTIIESVNGQLVLPKAKPGQSVSYSIMATDGTVLKEITMKTKPNTPKIARVASQKSEVLTKNKKIAITAQWKKDTFVKKYIVKITLENGKSITASTTDPNFSIITDETKGATITITAVGRNNLTSTVTRKI